MLTDKPQMFALYIETQIGQFRMAREGSVKLLHKAKKSKSDEFYTQYSDIQKEMLIATLF